jgi:hypothetical protein
MRDIEKFDTSLKCNLEPFGYIEDKKVIETKKAGKMVLIAFGALNRFGHYSPEFGGVAVVHLDPDLYVAVKYIPWNRKERASEIIRQAKYLEEHKQHITPNELICYFHEKNGYVLPAEKKKQKEAYINQVAENNKARAEEMEFDESAKNIIQEAAMRKSDYSDSGEKMIPLDDEEDI